mgnify:CR=1 FL=1
MKKSRGNYFFFINVSIRRLKEPVFACDADFFRVKLMNIFHAFHTHFHAFHTFHTFSHIFFTHIFVTDISECVIMCDFFSRMCARKSVIKNMCVTLRETRVTRCVTPLSSDADEPSLPGSTSRCRAIRLTIRTLVSTRGISF